MTERQGGWSAGNSAWMRKWHVCSFLVAFQVRLLLLWNWCWRAYCRLHPGLVLVSGRWKTSTQNQKTVFHAIMQQEIGWFDVHDVGELNTRLTK